MDADRFAALLAHLTTAPSRRAALRVLGGLGLAGLLGLDEASAKRKHKKKPACPTCPTCQECPTCPPPLPSPPPPPYCAGKSFCVSGPGGTSCQRSGTNCFCWLRADEGHIGEPFCAGTVGNQGHVDTCAACQSGQVCVLGGGTGCPTGYFCLLPCQDAL